MHSGIDSTSNIAPKNRIIYLMKSKEQIKEGSSSLTVLKTEIKKLVPQSCPCRLCKTYVRQMGAI